MKMSQLNAAVGTVAIAAIVASGMALPAQAQTEAAPAPPASSLCRAANRRTPIFESASTVSTAVRLVEANGQVTLTSLPAAGSQFAQISAPVAGHIQTAVLKACSTNPTPQSACRLVKNPPFINVRREADIPANPNSNVIGGVSAGDRVYVILTSSGGVSSKQADGYNWVEVDATRTPINSTGTGWIYNSIIGSNQSNLVLCP